MTKRVSLFRVLVSLGGHISQSSLPKQRPYSVVTPMILSSYCDVAPMHPRVNLLPSRFHPDVFPALHPYVSHIEAVLPYIPPGGVFLIDSMMGE